MAAGREGVPYVDLGHQAPHRHHPPDRREQRVVADEGGRRAGRTPGDPVAQAYRLYGNARVEGGLEDGATEGALSASAPGAALGEDPDGLTVAQRVRDAGDGFRQGAQPVAVDEKGAAGRERAGHGPVPDVGLGEHAGRADGGEKRDVQPGDVVGDHEQAAGGRGGAGDTDLDPCGPHDPPAPPLHQPGGDPPAERRQHDPGEHQGHDCRHPQHGTGYGRGGPPRLDARLGGAGRAGLPDAHQAGTRERKCRR
ncbi:hypothetical protein GCM10010276_30320 [Streptomyces longisporus]|uniref:Uncharacterized protein n=1 Tax=Streptomyces longisporus TaxID=1948 RepID=A0ABN3LVP6_STRLO